MTLKTKIKSGLIWGMMACICIFTIAALMGPSHGAWYGRETRNELHDFECIIAETKGFLVRDFIRCENTEVICYMPRDKAAGMQCRFK